MSEAAQAAVIQNCKELKLAAVVRGIPRFVARRDGGWAYETCCANCWKPS
jgi:hypothetical protein